MEVQISSIQNVPNPANAPHEGAGFLDRIVPSQTEYVNSLTGMDVAVALILLACGLVYLLQGWKVFKVLVIVNAAMLGMYVGGNMGRQFLHIQHGYVFGGVAGMLLLAVLAWPLMKFSVSLMGALAGGFVGYGLWSYVASAAGRQDLAAYTWVGTLLGFIALGLLGFVVFKMVIIMFTSMQGALMSISGLLGLGFRLEHVREWLEQPLRGNVHLLLLLIALPAIVGLVFQYCGMSKKNKKKPEGAA